MGHVSTKRRTIGARLIRVPRQGDVGRFFALASQQKAQKSQKFVSHRARYFIRDAKVYELELHATVVTRLRVFHSV